MEHQQTIISNLQDQINTEKKRTDVECKKHFQEGFYLAQKIAMLEEEGLYRQLKHYNNNILLLILKQIGCYGL